MKEHMADWRIHALAFVLTVIAEFIGTKKFSFGPLSFSLFPMLYVLILGAILGIAKMIPQKMMTEASPYIGISVMMLTAKIASTIGPNLGAVVKAGPALILQEFGNLGTAVLALPIAVFVFHMGRAAIGTSFSISRESSLAVVADKYGLDSDEGIGVMGGYITGTVFGTMFNGIFVSLPLLLKYLPSVRAWNGVWNRFRIHAFLPALRQSLRHIRIWKRRSLLTRRPQIC